MTTDTQLAPTDAELLGLNVGEAYFSESPSKYPEVHGTQYHAGAPGVLSFARAVLAKWGTPAPVGVEPVCQRCRGSGEDPEGYYDQSRGPDGATHDGPCRICAGTGERKDLKGENND